MLRRRASATAFRGIPCRFSAGSVANRCTSVSGSSRSRSASRNEGYLRTHVEVRGLLGVG
eukprot:17166-Chlamydomonas_euryale.AAC.2